MTTVYFFNVKYTNSNKVFKFNDLTLVELNELMEMVFLCDNMEEYWTGQYAKGEEL